jgi:hypothetical protein
MKTVVTRWVGVAAAALAVGATAVVAGGSGAAAASATPPWEPDPSAVGTITFYDASGHVITGGSSADKPFFAYAVGSANIRQGDVQGTVNTANPDPASAPTSWFVDQVGGFSNYPLDSGPANIKTLSQTHPVVTSANTDASLDDFYGESVHNTGTGYTDMIQLRLVTANSGGQQTTGYDSADVLIDPAAHTFQVVYPLAAPTADKSKLTISAPASVKYGATTKITCKLTDTTANAAVGATHVSLYTRPASGKPWSLVKKATTNSGGTATLAVHSTANAQFEWRYAGNSGHDPATSPVTSVTTSQVVAVAGSAKKVKHNKSVQVYGTVQPAGAGQLVDLQLSKSGKWKTVDHVKIKKQKLPNGKRVVGYLFSTKLKSKGSYKFRVLKPATRTLGAGHSATLTVRAT